VVTCGRYGFETANPDEAEKKETQAIYRTIRIMATGNLFGEGHASPGPMERNGRPGKIPKPAVRRRKCQQVAPKQPADKEENR
jgi:hypothetical protein